MGPRSVERGIEAGRRISGTLEIASMGPRSVERGIFANAGPFSKFFARFNGAALCRARNPDAVSIHQSRLNQLQWGRALSSAESKRLRYLPESGTALQWGRALSSAESYSAKNTDGLKEIASMGPRSVERGILFNHIIY